MSTEHAKLKDVLIMTHYTSYSIVSYKQMMLKSKQNPHRPPAELKDTGGHHFSCSQMPGKLKHF